MGYVSPDQDPFRAIADPRRRQMLDAMMDEERTVGELRAALGISQATVSQHLQVLKLAGLVDERRQGRNNFYRTRPAELADIAAWLDKYRSFWSERLDALEAHLQRKRN
ncbi:MAG: metalloregulator ArsR/SmtB family transcription factor [Hyphomicrobiales bacterium]|jgi:DNA-binding transcriptional ArsR family regulator|uniref:ArsR/SmtB family transcription factor n=1 Tax=Rhabdaerophilum sp. TaxID=2717341 RepID=UPI002A332D22|nr:winged helix-turn-helix transcriptional regulator [Methylobacterium sp.]MCA3637381.1 winged helix-turn-helix transcriptional regulator [Methylobacterium sp.]MCA3641925.1 winged helix-turn-helix transcriptional regulator [Methylobacterium sp.]MCE2931487.1 metalloregulator ArsR/SmtB family transcription factor [Hyphomicrobiales bacterium]